MKKTSLALLTLIAILPLAAVAGPPAFEDVLSEDSGIVLMLSDAPSLRSSWSSTPLVRAWDDPQLQAFLAPFRDMLQADQWDETLRESSGLGLEELLGLFQGQVALALPKLEQLMEAAEDESGETMPPFAILAVVGDKAAELEQLLTLALDDDTGSGAEHRKVEEEFQGVTLHLHQVATEDDLEEREGWALLDDVAVLAYPKSFLQEIVAGVAAGNVERPLSGSPSFQKMKQRSGDSDLFVFGSLDGLVPILEEAFKEDASAEPNPLGITPEVVLAALSLDVLQAGYLATSLADGATELDYGLLYSENRGLVKALAFQPARESRPQMISDDAVAASVTHFSYAAMYETLQEILQRISPMLSGMVNGYIQQMAVNIGVNLEESLLGSLGDEISSASFFRPAEPGQESALEDVDELYAVSVTDRQSLEMALEALKTLLGEGGDLFEIQDYLGTTLYTFKQPLALGEGLPEQMLCYALTDQYLLVGVGSEAPVRAALSALKTPGSTIWERSDVKASLAGLPPGASAISFQDTSAYLNGWLQSMLNLQEMGAETEAEVMFDPEARPDAEIFSRYFGPAVSGIYQDSGGIYLKLRLLAPGS